MTAYPLAADVLSDALDSYTLQGLESHRRMKALQGFLPPANEPGSGVQRAEPTPALLDAIERARRETLRAETIIAEIRGGIEKLRTP